VQAIRPIAAIAAINTLMFVSSAHPSQRPQR
jgi:hypothetical protein